MSGSLKVLQRAPGSRVHRLHPSVRLFWAVLLCSGAAQTVVINWRAGVSGLGRDRAGTGREPGVGGHRSASSCAGSAEMCPSALLTDAHHQADGMC